MEDPEDHPEILELLLKSCALKKAERKTYEQKGYPDVFRCFSLTDSKCEYGFLYYQNNNDETTLREYVQFSKLENMEPVTPYEGENLEVIVEPNTTEIVLFRRVARSCSFNCTYFSSFILPPEKTAEKLR